MKNILEYDNKAARKFFLKEESYFNFDLPQYFTFKKVIEKAYKKIEGKATKSFYATVTDGVKTKPDSPRNYDDVNYKILGNKDGKFAWRPFQLIHPILYASLVNQITTKESWDFIIERFEEFRSNEKIRCLSIPLESKGKVSDKALSIINWWREIEQESLRLALKFEYVLHTDITDCYGSVYSHSVVWALHGKSTAKVEKSNKTLIGNQIDWHLQDMSFGQTNGIPQGSTLMDFIAEIVLGYADFQLSERLSGTGIEDFQIIRYRDDYRVFANNPQHVEFILKNITEILIDLGMKLNSGKTLVSSSIVSDSIKPDKLFWIATKRRPFNFQEHLLTIHSLSIKYPNSGTLVKELNEFFNKIRSIKKSNESIPVLISILVDIAFKNPKTYPISAAILSKLLSKLKTKKEKGEVIDLIRTRFEKIPNTGHLQIWLQRITYKFDKSIEYGEHLCGKVLNQETEIWNSDWLNNNLKEMIEGIEIVDRKKLARINSTISSVEVQLFESKSNYPY